MKIWLLFWASVAATLVMVAHNYGGIQRAWLLMVTFLQSEAAIGKWMGIAGYSAAKAIVICAAIGAVAITHHYLAADLLVPVLDWLGVASAKNIKEKTLRRPGRMLYPTICILCLLPDGGAFVGIIIAKKCKLNRWGAFVMIQLGNLLKNIAFGIGFNFLSLLRQNVSLVATSIMIVSAVLLTMPYLKSTVSRLRRTKTPR